MTFVLALIAVLVPASVTLFGYWFKQQSEKRLTEERKQAENRLAQEKDQSDKRLAQEQEQQNERLRLDAAMRAADLFGPSGQAASSAARSASGLLALTRLSFADLAVAQLVNLWSPKASPLPSEEVRAQESSGVSTETAIQVIDAALEGGEEEAQVMAAAVLCRNAKTLDICDPLHWPSSVDSAWIPGLPVTAKLLIVDALIHMALASAHTKNALRELAIRLYGISVGDPEPRVKGCVGTLLKAIMPAVKNLGYTDFMRDRGPGFITLKQIEEAAAKASHHPDGYFEMIVKDRSERLKKWSQECTTLSFQAGILATAASAPEGEFDSRAYTT